MEVNFREFLRAVSKERDSDWPGDPLVMVKDRESGKMFSVKKIEAEPRNEGEGEDCETVGATIWIEVEEF